MDTFIHFDLRWVGGFGFGFEICEKTQFERDMIGSVLVVCHS